MHGTPALSGVKLADIRWHPDGRRVTFLRAPHELRAFDVERGRETPLFAVDPGQRPGSLAGYQWAPDGRRCLVVFEGDLYLVDARERQRLTQTPEDEEFPSFAPDGLRVAYVRSGDLYVFHLGQRREWRLTQAESADVRNGRLDWVYEEELASRKGKAYLWSPDGRTIAYLRLDDSAVPRVSHIDLMAPHKPPTFQSFPAPGDPLPAASLGLVRFDAEGRPAGDVRVPLRDADYLLPQLQWTPDGRRLAYQTLDRRQRRLELRLLDAEATLRDGTARESLILAETDAAWVNVLGAPAFLKDGRAFLWLSERSGPRHVYRCATSDGACTDLTPGSSSVHALVGVDETAGRAYCTAGHPLPRQRGLFAVPLAGGGLTPLGPPGGLHEAALSPDGRALVDTYSTTESPTRVDAVRLPSLSRRAIETNAEAPVHRYEIGRSRWVDVKAADGVVLQGLLRLPADAENGGRRPAVVSVYGGPGVPGMLDDWDLGLETLLASRGYVVLQMENRGVQGRGHAFEVPLNGELGRTELADQLAGIELLRSLPYVDPQRIGIFGTSYGGFLSLYATVHAPDVFRAAAVGAPVTDWRRYDATYTERYLGLPADNSRGYDASAILGHARAIRARLLLHHGTSDDNVHLSHTIRLIQELTKAGVPYDLALHPGERHGGFGAANKIARDKAILQHFERWLAPPLEAR